MSVPEIGSLARPSVFRVGFRLSGSNVFARVTFRTSLLMTHRTIHSHPTSHVGSSICLRSNHLKHSADSPSLWSELAVVAKLTGGYFWLLHARMRVLMVRVDDHTGPWWHRLNPPLAFDTSWRGLLRGLKPSVEFDDRCWRGVLRGLKINPKSSCQKLSGEHLTLVLCYWKEQKAEMVSAVPQ